MKWLSLSSARANVPDASMLDKFTFEDKSNVIRLAEYCAMTEKKFRTGENGIPKRLQKA